MIDLQTLHFLNGEQNSLKPKFDLESKIKAHWRKEEGPRYQKYNARWSGEFETGNWGVYQLLHYGVPILKIDVAASQAEILEGVWNSVSDVQGVNKCLAAFNLPYHYSKVKGLEKI